MSRRASSLVVTADDCTGALETAATCADMGWDAAVTRSGPLPDAACSVLDLGTRHVGVDVAAARVRHVAERYHVHAHKIDSALRGNWDVEVMTYVASGRLVLLIPAHPEAGRTCVGGVVRVHGVPVHRTEHGADPRSSARSSRPAARLEGSVELAGGAVERWLAGPRSGAPIAVADASTVAEIEHLIGMVHRAGAGVGVGDSDSDVLVCGPSAVIRALAGCAGLAARPALPTLHPPALVVIGSRHRASRDQLEALRTGGVAVFEPGGVPDRPGWIAAPTGRVVALATDPLVALDPDEAARSLAAAAHASLAADAFPLGDRFRTVVLVGGDTAGAFIGERPVRVHGTRELGVAQGTIEIDGREIAIVAKPGAFGDDGTLVRLMNELAPA